MKKTIGEQFALVYLVGLLNVARKLSTTTWNNGHVLTKSTLITNTYSVLKQFKFLFLLLLLFSSTAQAQQAILVYDTSKPDIPLIYLPNNLVDIGYHMKNVSGIDATNYRLQEFNTTFGDGIASYPIFSIPAGGEGEVWIRNFPIVNQTVRVYFDILDENGAPLPTLPLGKLYVDFIGGTSVCEEPPLSGADTTAPLITDVIVQSHDGQFFVQATVTDGCGVGSVVLEINGQNFTLLPDPGSPTRFSLATNVPTNQTLGYRIIATDLVGNAGIWDPDRGYVAYTASATYLGQEYAGFNGCNAGPKSERGKCSSVFTGGQSTSDPVNTVSGNLVDHTYLLTIPGRPPIDFHLTFNNQGGRESIFGLNMTHTYNYHLNAMDNPQFTGAFVQYPDGHVVAFEDYEAESGYFETLEKTSNGYVLTFKDLHEVSFNEDGNIERYQDANGNGVNFSYSDISPHTLRSKLVSIQADGGREITFSYNGEGLVGSIGAPESKTLSFDYTVSLQDQGDLTPYLLSGFTDGNGNTTMFVYDETNNLLEKTSPGGHPYFVNEFDSDKRVTRQTIGSGYAYDFSYVVDLANESIVSEATTKDANGQEVTYHFGDGLLIERIDQNGNSESYTYTADKKVASATDKNGSATLYEYDALGNATKITDALGQVVMQDFDPAFSKPTHVMYKQFDHVTDYAHDARGNVTRITHALGNDRTFSYNALGQLTQGTDFNGNATRYTYTTQGDIATVIYADGGVETFAYDGLGRVTSHSDPEGNPYLYDYDYNDNLLSVQGPLGYQNQFSYDANNHRVSITDANGGTVSYEYDDQENMVSQSDQLGLARHYHFGAMNELIEEVDEEGVGTEYHYDSAYRITEIIKAADTGDESTTKHTFDAQGNVLSITDAEGRITTQTYDALHRRVAIVENTTTNLADHQNNVTTTFVYSPTNRVIKAVDGNGNATTYTYDQLDRQESVLDAENQQTQFVYDAQSNRTALTNPRGFQTSYVFDSKNRVSRKTDALGGQTRYGYDHNDRLTSVQDANGTVTIYTFDALNRRTETIQGYSAGGVADGDTNVTTLYDYDLQGNVTGISNPRGFVSYFSYDPTHRVTQVTDALGQTTSYDYDNVDNVIGLTNRRGHRMEYDYDYLYRRTVTRNEEQHAETVAYDRVGNALTFENRRGFSYTHSYDPLNRRISTTDPDGFTKQNRYDAVGNVLSLSDENGHIDRFAYDRIYRQVEETDAEGFLTQYQFDQNNNLIRRIDAEGNANQYSFDELDRLVSVLNAEQELEQYAYDALTNRVKRTEADGTNHTFNYDNLYRLAQVINNATGGSQTQDANVVTHYDYDSNGNLLVHSDPNQHDTAFTYDALDRLATEVNAVGSTWRYGYDPEGNTTLRKDANGTDTTYSYYPDHKLKSVAYPAYDVNFSYNENNLREEMRDQLGTTSWSYDKLDRLTSQDDPMSRVVSYIYDPVGNLTSLTYPDQRSIAHTYLQNDWHRTSITNEQDTITVNRNNVGAPVKHTRSNATTSDIGYDRVYRAVSVEDKQYGGALITRFDYTYNPIGHLTQEVADYGWLQPNRVRTEYAYDGLHRLTQERNDDALTNTYVYDPVGNRASLSEKIKQGLATSMYRYDAANRMTDIDVSSSHYPDNAQHTFAYDDNGNRVNQLLQSNGVDRSITYAYDTENRLTQVQNSLIAGGGNGNIVAGEPCNSGNGSGLGNGCNYQGNISDDSSFNGNITELPDLSTEEVGNSGGNGILSSVLQKQHTDLAYDGVGRRLISTYYPGSSDAPKQTEFTFDRKDPITEYATWNQHKTNLYRDHRQNLLVKHSLAAGDYVTAGNRFFYHHDGQGNITALTKHQGQADKSYRYEAYGNVTHPSNNAALQQNDYSLSQKRFDASTDLSYFGSRHYDAFTGTWLTQDTYRGELSNPMSLHRTMYNYDSPVNYVDPYGEFGVELFVGEGNGAAWASLFAEKWVKGPTGGKLPESLANDISSVARNLPGDAANNGMHAWHAGSNALMAEKFGLLGAPLIFVAGVYHETPLDWSSFRAEQHYQGTVNHFLDSVTDVCANIFGMGVGYSGGGVDRAVHWGNLIPGPGETDPAFGGGGPYNGHPSDAWGN